MFHCGPSIKNGAVIRSYWSTLMCFSIGLYVHSDVAPSIELNLKGISLASLKSV